MKRPHWPHLVQGMQFSDPCFRLIDLNGQIFLLSSSPVKLTSIVNKPFVYHKEALVMVGRKYLLIEFITFDFLD